MKLVGYLVDRFIGAVHVKLIDDKSNPIRGCCISFKENELLRFFKICEDVILKNGPSKKFKPKTYEDLADYVGNNGLDFENTLDKYIKDQSYHSPAAVIMFTPEKWQKDIVEQL